ncbi:MAG TPA: TonB family protein [Geobacteraceae bacterium]
MTDRYIEKTFLFLVVLSLLVHGVAFYLLTILPTPEPKPSTEPLFVDLQDLPELKSPVRAPPKDATHHAEQPQRVPRETAPRGESPRDQVAPPTQAAPRQPVQPRVAEPSSSAKPAERSEMPFREAQSKEELFRSKPAKEKTDLAKLFPSAGNMAKLEAFYRRKYGDEVAEGETVFLNTDDILFGSFLRRFETAVYGVWRYPAEAARMGVEGVTPVRVTFNRKGEIVKREILQSSGSKILDDEVLRTLDQLGAVGSFPRGYTKDTFNLIAFFQYGLVKGGARMLR